MIGFLAAVLCLLQASSLMAQTEYTFEFDRCPSHVEAYFKAIYPEYKTSNRRRRLQEEHSANDPISIFLRRQQQFSPYAGQKRGDATARTSSSFQFLKQEDNNDEKKSSRLSGVSKLLPKIDPALFNMRPPLDAWNKARMAATGCTSCETGCCDAADITLDCGKIRVPLNYPDLSENITLTTYRVRITSPTLSPPTRKHLWLLQGGPGGSGLSIIRLAIHSLQFATDIYLPDHRGTHLSSELKCPTQQAPGSAGGVKIVPSEVSGCYQFGKQEDYGVLSDSDFKQFTTTAAARDLEIMITAAKQEFTPLQVFIHGFSYGTRWASRFLQLFPTTVDRVVLEGVVAKDTYFNDFATGSQEAGTRFMEKCLLDQKCSNYFSSSSLASTVDAIVQMGNSNLCSAVWVDDTSRKSVHNGVRILLYFGLVSGIEGPYKDIPGQTGDVFVDFRTFTLALVSRWARCDNLSELRAFIAGITFILSTVGGLVPNASLTPTLNLKDEDFMNEIVYGMVTYSDLYRPLDDEATYNSTHANVDWGTVNSYADMKADFDSWTAIKYPSDVYANESASNVTSDVLLLNGEIDGQTPRSNALKEFINVGVTGPGIKDVAIVLDQGHYASGYGCGFTKVKTFLAGTSSGACSGLMALSGSPPVEPAVVQQLSTGFTMVESFSLLLMGSMDLWSGSQSKLYCTVPPEGEAAINYCQRCFDHCLLVQPISSPTASNCDCVFQLKVCLAYGGVQDPTEQCVNMRNRYGNGLGIEDFSNTGKCGKTCHKTTPEATRQLLTLIASILIPIIVIICFCTCFYYRSRQNYAQDGIILGQPAPANQVSTTPGKWNIVTPGTAESESNRV